MEDGMSLRDTAHFLNVSTQDVVKLAEKGRLPGTKRAGRWEFNRRSLLDQFEQEMGTLPPERLAAVEKSLAADMGGDAAATAGAVAAEPSGLLLSPLMCVEGIALPLPARTRASVLGELVALAGKTDLVWDPSALLDAVRRREDQCGTALENGVAAPHPRRVPENCIAESFVVFGRTASGIPFNAMDGKPTDLFFLVCCTDERTHLQVLARLCRILRDAALLEGLRSVEDAAAALELIRVAESADLAVHK